MEFSNSLIKNLAEFWGKYVVVLSILLSIILFTVSYALNTDYPAIAEFLKTGGNAILSGGVFMGIAKSIQFTGIFKKELSGIVNSPSHLKKRKDIDEIWDNVSKIMYEEKFPEISEEVHNAIRNSYMPITDLSYFSEYEYDITIEKEPGPDKSYFKLIEETRCTLTTSSTKPTPYVFTSGINFMEGDEDKVFYRLNELRVNGKEIDITEVLEKSTVEGKKAGEKILKIKVELDLKGEKIYKIIKKETKKYSVDVNNKWHNAMRMYNKPKINVFYPKDCIEVAFNSSGTIDKFDLKSKPRGGTTEHLSAQYDGIVLKSQGFFLLLSKKS